MKPPTSPAASKSFTGSLNSPLTPLGHLLLRCHRKGRTAAGQVRPPSLTTPKSFLTALKSKSKARLKPPASRAVGSSQSHQVAEFCDQPRNPHILAHSKRVKHIKHQRLSAEYLQLYTLQSSLYFVIWEYIYYIIFFCVFLYGKLKHHQKRIAFPLHA